MLRLLAPKNAVAVVGNDSVEPVKTAMTNAVTILKSQKPPVPVYSVSFTAATDFTTEAIIQAKLNPPPGTPTADVVLVCSDPLMRTYGTPFVQAAHDMPTGRMNTMCEFAEWHDEHKGDLCFGPDFKTLFQSAADYVDDIIGPTNKPVTTLPIVSPTVADCKQTPLAYHAR
jgi:hypothetical protein